jgi:predicted ATPase/class 3 adenylate cyclase
MRHLISHFIQENFAKGNLSGQFNAVGLFVDLSSFTAMTSALMEHGSAGAEELVVVMQAVFGPLVECVYAQGGFIARTAGDAFTALFPLRADEDILPRALAAARGMQQSRFDNAVQLTNYGSFTIQAKIGLAAGSVGWGIVSSQDGRRSAFYFQGRAVDGCAAAEHQAAPGEIILDAAIQERVKALAAVEPVGDWFRLVDVTSPLPLPQPVELPPPNPAVMAHFYPEALIHQTRSGEFRQVINLFVSLPTVRNEAQLATFMNTVFELQDRYGGLLSALDFGDKGSNLLLFWGAPVAYENDIERTLNFITDLQSLTSIPINAGVTYNLAHAGFLGSQILDEYTCYGRGINLAARLMASARRGEIWVSEAIAQRAQGQFDFELLGEMTFKGFHEQQPVYLLLERKEAREAFFSGKMVGRRNEIQRLSDFVALLWQGKSPGVLVVWGEPGVGKSRLVYEFQNSETFTQQSSLWAVCQTSEILREPFNPFRYWLRGYLEQSEGQPEARNKRNFNRKLDDLIANIEATHATLANELDHARSFLGALVGLHWPDSLYEQVDPQGRYENTLTALIVLLQAESLRQPVLLLLEDAHWLDDDTRDFLPRLNRAMSCDECQSFPLAVVATARRESSGPLLGAGLNYQEITLTGISEAELVSLADGFLKGPASPVLLQLLAARAEGNPFFAEQSLRYLREEGLLALKKDGWDLIGSLDHSPLPTDVGAVLVARLDRLTFEVKNVVQTASILGREFEVQLLSRMLHGDKWLHEKVADAAQAAIWTALDEFHYLFKHALLREAAYRMQVSTRRRELHTLAVEAMEGLFSQELSPHYGELAYHCEQAGLKEKARSYLELAGDNAQEAYLNSQALDYYSRALGLTPEDDPQARYALLVKRIPLLRVRGDISQQLQDLQTLDPLAKALDDLEAIPGAGRRWAETLELWASYYVSINDYPSAIATSEQAVAAARLAGGLNIAVEAHVEQSYCLLRLGQHTEALQQSLQALELARLAGYPHGEVLALNQLGLIATERNDVESARFYLQHCLTRAQEIGKLRVVAASLTNLGNLVGSSGNFIAAQDYFQQALGLARQIGDRGKEGMVLGNLGWVSGSLGDYASARMYSAQNLKIAREVGDRYIETFELINLSSYSGRLGDLEAALNYAQQGLGLASQAGDRSAQAWALTYLGNARLGSGNYKAAMQAYQGALEIRQALNQPNLACEPLAGLAQAALQSGDIITAAEYTETILSYLQKGGTLDGTDEPLRVYLSCYQVLQAANKPQADEILKTAYALLQKKAEGIPDPAQRRTFLEGIPYHREIISVWESGSMFRRPNRSQDHQS